MLAAAVLVVCAVCLAALWRRERALRLRAEHLRQQERTGRTRAEHALAASAASRAAPDTSDHDFSCRAIGHLRSVFRRRDGTPRQPGLVPSARAVLEVSGVSDARAALEGLEEFSHCWVIFSFHANTNAHRAPGQFKSKIRPPKLGGRAMGVFATRSPHHPCGIGMSVARIDRIVGAAIHLSGVDIIDGTPVLDVKPYIAFSDALPAGAVRSPAWLDEPFPAHPVALSAAAETQLADFYARAGAAQRRQSLYAGAAEAAAFVREALRLDVRSAAQRARGAASHTALLDAFSVRFAYGPAGVCVEACEPLPASWRPQQQQQEDDGGPEA
eukprot:m51a1_g6572 hypothetical protein (328) ;mRNA; f:184320-185599